MSKAAQALARAGVFKGAEGLEDFANADEFWREQPYGTRLYFGDGIADYLHRDVLRAAVSTLAELAAEDECTCAGCQATPRMG